MGFPYFVSCFKGWDSWREDFQVDDWAYISWAELGMGDHNAVDLAQEMHFNALSQAGQFQPQHLITYPYPIPFNSDGYFEGVMIDDRVGLQLHRDDFWSNLNRDLK